MKRILSATVPRHLHLLIEFDDGVRGELDLSNFPRNGVFSAWDDPEFFTSISIGDGGRFLEWPDEIDLCADSLWMDLTGKPPEAVYSGLTKTHA